MFRFAKPNGERFGLDYTGPICVFASGNDRIALCPGEWILEEGDRQVLEEWFGFKDSGGEERCGDPARWDDWEVFIGVAESQRPILQRAIASAWSAVTLCERMLVDISEKNQLKEMNF